MKEKLLRILKYVGIGFGGLVVFIVALAIVLPDTDTAPTPITAQEESSINNEEELDEVVAEDIGDDETKESESSTEIAEQKDTQADSQPDTNQTTQTSYYTVTSIVDGDTLKVDMNGTIETLRLIGIDTPETVDPRKPVQCFGTEASNKARALLLGQKVRIESDSSQDTRDKYGRLLVYVYRSDGLFFNKSMVEQGMPTNIHTKHRTNTNLISNPRNNQLKLIKEDYGRQLHAVAIPILG